VLIARNARTTLGGVPALAVRPIDPADTRVLRQAVLRPHEPLEELATHELPGTFAVGAFDDGALIAVGFIHPDDAGAWRVRGMATLPGARGRGAGAAILGALVDHARERGASHVWCTARIPATAFYERGGFTVTSEPFDVLDIGPHVRMELTL